MEPDVDSFGLQPIVLDDLLDIQALESSSSSSSPPPSWHSWEHSLHSCDQHQPEAQTRSPSLSSTDIEERTAEWTPILFPTPADGTESVPVATLKRFRLHARNLFLTFPQCDIPPQGVLNNIVDHMEVEWVIVGQDTHTDGSLHLHCVVRLQKPRSWKRADCFDFLTGKHGDYRAARNLQDVVRYVAKCGVLKTHNINVASFLKARQQRRSTKGDTVMQLVNECKTFQQITKLHPGYAMIHRQQIKAMIGEIRQWTYNSIRSDWVCPSLSDAPDPEQGHIIGWLMDNIRRPRKFKAPQLFIWGDVNLGKTSFLNHLDSMLKIYWIPQGENFDDLWVDHSYDLAVMDAFKGHRSITWLEQFAQGGTQPLRTKGGQTMKRHNVPLILCSNHPIADCYPNVTPLRVRIIEARFMQVELHHFINFYI